MLHIACSSDARSAPDCAAMLASLTESNRGPSLYVHLLHDESLSASVIGALGGIVTEAGGSFDAVNVARARPGALQRSERFPSTIWNRIALPTLLPDLPRVLYIDADALITAPLDRLWDTDLQGCPVGATTDPLYYPMMAVRVCSELGLPDRTSYFNSGVLLVDLSAWRADRIAEAIFDFAGAHPYLTWPDQDALNAILHARRMHLHPRWNAMPGLWDLALRNLPYPPQAAREAISSPAIVHFVGPYKPWHYRSRHPYRDLYFRCLDRTPWRGREIEGKSLGHFLLRPLPPVIAYRLEIALVEWRIGLHHARARAAARLQRLTPPQA